MYSLSFLVEVLRLIDYINVQRLRETNFINYYHLLSKTKKTLEVYVSMLIQFKIFDLYV